MLVKFGQPAVKNMNINKLEYIDYKANEVFWQSISGRMFKETFPNSDLAKKRHDELLLELEDKFMHHYQMEVIMPPAQYVINYGEIPPLSETTGIANKIEGV